MIEVEKKFVCSTDNLAKLTDGAKFLGEKSFTDSYYDKDYFLAYRDNWLRNRSSKWELKLPLSDLPKANRLSEQYREIESESEIANHLGFDLNKPLITLLEANGYKPFATIVTHRRKYSKEGFNIDVDSTDFNYQIIEIELMVKNEDDMIGATNRILKFARSLGLTEGVVRGKISEYLYRFKNEDHKLLLNTGILSK